MLFLQMHSCAHLFMDDEDELFDNMKQMCLSILMEKDSLLLVS